MAFDVQSARKAGYTDAEIADFLAKETRFDAAAARKSGYSDSEIVSHLQKTSAPKKVFTPGRDFGATVKGAWDKLTTDTADDFRATTTRKAPRNLFEAGAQSADDLGRTARMAGNVFNLAASPVIGAVDALVTKPAARGLNKLSVRPYTQDNPFAKPRPMYGDEAEAALTESVGTALAGARPGPVRFGPPKPRPQAPMKPTQLKAAKEAAYAKVEQSGVRYKGSTFNGLVDVIEAELKAEGLNPLRNPKAASMLDDIKKLKGQQPSLSELDKLRQTIRLHVIQSGDDADARLGQVMIRQIDDFIDVAGKKQVVTGSTPTFGPKGLGQQPAGDPKAAAAAIREARGLNTRLRKVEAVEDAVESARYRAGSTGSGGNVDNATRQNLRRVLEDTGNLTADEKKALEKIVLGGHGQNFLRQIGKLSPQGNGLMTALNIGGAAANPWLAIPGVAGLFSKMTADAMTAKKVERLIRLMAAGGAKASMRRPLPRVPSPRGAVGVAEVASPLVHSPSDRASRTKAPAGR